jgi:hypothetical protein
VELQTQGSLAACAYAASGSFAFCDVDRLRLLARAPELGGLVWMCHRVEAARGSYAAALSRSRTELSTASVGTEAIVVRMRPAMRYGSPSEFGRRSSR